MGPPAGSESVRRQPITREDQNGRDSESGPDPLGGSPSPNRPQCTSASDQGKSLSNSSFRSRLGWPRPVRAQPPAGPAGAFSGFSSLRAHYGAWLWSPAQIKLRNLRNLRGCRMAWSPSRRCALRFVAVGPVLGRERQTRRPGGHCPLAALCSIGASGAGGRRRPRRRRHRRAQPAPERGNH